MDEVPSRFRKQHVQKRQATPLPESSSACLPHRSLIFEEPNGKIERAANRVDEFHLAAKTF
jgi:hypothetical protein